MNSIIDTKFSKIVPIKILEPTLGLLITHSTLKMGFYKKAVQLERKRFQQYKQRTTAIMQTEKIITPERQMYLYRNYLQEAVLVRKESEGDSEE